MDAESWAVNKKKGSIRLCDGACPFLQCFKPARVVRPNLRSCAPWSKSAS